MYIENNPKKCLHKFYFWFIVYIVVAIVNIAVIHIIHNLGFMIVGIQIGIAWLFLTDRTSYSISDVAYDRNKLREDRKEL